MEEKIIEYFKSLTDEEKHAYIKTSSINLNKAFKSKQKHNHNYLYTNNDRIGLRDGKHSTLYAKAMNQSDIYNKELDIFKKLVKLL